VSVVSSTPDVNQDAWRDLAVARTPEEFFRSWLTLQCQMIRGVRAGLIVAGSTGSTRFVPVAVWPEGQRIQHLSEIAERALAERRGVVVRRPREASIGPTGVSGSIDAERVDIAYPIEVNGKLHGVVAIDLSGRPETEVQAALRELQWGAGWLEALVHRVAALRIDPQSAESAKRRLQAILELVASALGHERFDAAAAAFATALATRLECDRVAIGLIQNRRAHVRGVSHSAEFGRQTNLMRAIEAAMDEAADQATTIVYPPRASDDVGVSRAHAELAAQHGAVSICTVPLAEGGRVVGALTAERPAAAPFDQSTIDFVEAVAAVAGPILELQWRDDRALASKAVERGRRFLTHLFGPAHVALKLGVVGVAAGALILGRVKGDYRVSARTTIEARVQRAAVAPFNGYISEAPARAGDLVKRGQILAALDDRDLQLQRLRSASQQQQLTREYEQALAGREAAHVNIVSAQLAQARAQLSLIEEELARTRVVAPFDGVVVTGDLSQSLNAPVERGQVLFEIAPLEEYRIVMQVDERDIGDVRAGQNGQLLLSAWPSDTWRFTVVRATPVSTAREGRNYFRVECRLEDALAPDRLRPGMEGVGKISVDRRLLARIWLRDGVDWARLKLWTWLP